MEKKINWKENSILINETDLKSENLSFMWEKLFEIKFMPAEVPSKKRRRESFVDWVKSIFWSPSIIEIEKGKLGIKITELF